MIVPHRSLWTLGGLLLGGHVAASQREIRQAAPNFALKWTIPKPFSLNVNQTISWQVVGGGSSQSGTLPQLYLLWTNLVSGVPDASNTWALFDPPFVCDAASDPNLCSWADGSMGNSTINVGVNGDEGYNSLKANQGNFFFCVGPQKNHTCRVYSTFFNLDIQEPPKMERRQSQVPLATPTGELQITQTTNVVTSSGFSPPTSVTAPAASPSETRPLTTIDGSVYLVASRTPTSPSAEPSSAIDEAIKTKSSKGGLPIGAIIGIAVGGALLVLGILIAIFFCYRRKRRTGTPSEQVLLADNMVHHHNISRDIVAEKADHNSSMLTSILETRPSSGPYDHLTNSAPYTGTLGPGAGPRRKTTSATLATMETNITRGISDASARTPVSPRSTVGGRDDDTYEEPYQDVPVYGDARHMPKVFAGTQGPFLSSSPTPFLSEPGMTDEELSRLEEEERRIDAAIAEAERRR